MDRDRLVLDLQAVLADRADIELALLFGSWARGTESAGSDVDVAIEGHGIDRLTLARDLSMAVGREVDVTDLATAGQTLLQVLLRDSVVIHEGRPHANARFRTRAILQTELDRSHFERMENSFLNHLAGQASG